MASMTVDFPEPLLPLKRFTYSLNSNTLWLIPPQLFKHMRVKIFFVLLNFFCSFFLWDAKLALGCAGLGGMGTNTKDTLPLCVAGSGTKSAGAVGSCLASRTVSAAPAL